MDKLYRGLRAVGDFTTAAGSCLVEVYRDGHYAGGLHRADPDEVSGFEWGYQGTGPYCLALSLLNDVVGFSEAEAHAQALHESVVAELPRNVPPRGDVDFMVEWELSEGALLAFIVDDLRES